MNPTLVIGGTGKTGRRVVARLQDRGLPVRVANRPGFDWNEPSTWPAAVEGVDAAYVTYAPDLVFPGGPEAVAGLAELAARSGVRRLVLLSGRGEPEAFRAEQLFAAAIGRPIDYRKLSTEEFVDQLVEAGLPAEEAEGVGGLFADVLDGRNESLSNGIRQALGREPRDFVAFAESAAAGGAWSVRPD